MKITTRLKNILLATALIGAQLVSFAQDGSIKQIIFAAKPFSTNPTPQTEFKANTPIYGRVVLDKPLKEYCKNPSKHLSNVPSNYARLIGIIPENQFDEDGNEKFDPIIPINFEMYLTFEDLEKSYIDFDVMPKTEEATTVYSSGLAFYRSFADQGTDVLNKKCHYGIKLYTEFNESNSDIMGLKAAGDLYIDFTNSNSTTQEQWAAQCQKAQTNAAANALKNASKNAADQVKSLPLPTCFTFPQHKGYADPKYSAANIIAMIKQKFGVTEVLNLTFDKPDAENDFRSLVDASTNEPSHKMGNHVFYFAFKDPDGTYRFSGGVLKMDYEGYGKYGQAYIFPYSPIQGEERFPIDELRKQNDVYGVFVFDGSKLPAKK